MSQHRSTRMPFGRYRGERLDDIPLSYLFWVRRECTNIEPELREAVDAEIRDRMGAPPRSPSSGTDHADRDEPSREVIDVRGIVRKWHREMVLRYHPDRTLSDGKEMSAINAAAERLKELLNVDR